MAAQGTDLIAVSRGGTNYKVALSDVVALASGGAVGAHAVMPVPSGKFAQLALNNGYTTTGVVNAGNQSYWPFLPARNLTIDAIAAEVTTLVAGGNAFLAIYSSDANGKPAAKLAVTGSLSTASTGSKLGVLGANQTLNAGTLYFLSLYSPAGSATWRQVNVGSALMLPSLETTANTTFYHWNGTAAVVENVPTGSLLEGAQLPAHIRLRVA